MIKIVTDTTCDLPNEWLSQHNITTIPINIQFGLETFHDKVTISPNTFYARIKTDGVLPTTSQPSIGEFREVYQTLAADGSEILSIHVTSKLSGTWQTAKLATSQSLAAGQQLTDNPLGDKINVTVFDSLTGSVGLGLMVREAAQLVEAGLTVTEIVQHLESRRSQVNVFIMLKDLRYARMSGRVGRLRETLASLLNVKPIVGVDDGALVSLERVRGQKKGFERMLALAQETVGNAPIHLGMTHAINQPQAENLLAQAKQRLNCQDTFITDLALSLAVHFGPGTVGFATYPAK